MQSWDDGECDHSRGFDRGISKSIVEKGRSGGIHGLLLGYAQRGRISQRISSRDSPEQRAIVLDWIGDIANGKIDGSC